MLYSITLFCAINSLVTVSINALEKAKSESNEISCCGKLSLTLSHLRDMKSNTDNNIKNDPLITMELNI